jgi:hypothetical protein
MLEGPLKWIVPLILIAIIWILYFLEMYLTIDGAIAFSTVIILLSGTYLWGWEWEDD